MKATKPDSTNDDLFDTRLHIGLRELEGIDTPPDVADRVLAGSPSRAKSRRRRTTNALAAVIVVALGLAAAVGVWTASDDKPSQAPVAPYQDPLPSLPPPVTVRTPLDIIELPVTTAHVRGVGLSGADLRALQRVSGLRGLTLSGRFDPAGIPELSRLDKLERIVIDGALLTKHAALLESLRTLPRLRVLGVTFDDVDDSVLRSIATLEKLHTISFRGELVCTAAGMTHLAKRLKRLRRFSIEKYQSPRSGITPVSDDVWNALPTSLVELKLHHRSIRIAALRRLPGLKKLDLFGCGNIGRELLQIAGNWRGCEITTPSGAPLLVDAKGRCTPQPIKVVLIQRKDNGTYRASAYSFRHLSSRVEDHNNDIDLLFNGCGNVHINPHGNSNSRILDLGKTDDVPALDKLPKTGWLDGSFRPTVGHLYLQEVGRKGGDKMVVQIRVVKAEAGRVWLTWQHCDAEQLWKMSRPKRGGRFGTMGQCGGPHRAR